MNGVYGRGGSARLGTNRAASLVVQHIGSATLERNAEAKEMWADITARFAATL